MPFDLVGNNFPVFFIHDGMKFPDMVHALKPNPKSHIQNWIILDFFSHHPESLYMFTFLFDDVEILQDYKHTEGSGVNTYYTLFSKAGKVHYVKFHWKPTSGVKCLLEDEAIKVGGSNHSHATKDTYDSIAAGNYPEWKLFIQTINFDPLDVTKT